MYFTLFPDLQFFNLDGHFLVSSDGNRKVTLFNTDYEKPHQREWGFHTAKVLLAEG